MLTNDIVVGLIKILYRSEAVPVEIKFLLVVVRVK